MSLWHATQGGCLSVEQADIDGKGNRDQVDQWRVGKLSPTSAAWLPTTARSPAWGTTPVSGRTEGRPESVAWPGALTFDSDGNLYASAGFGERVFEIEHG
jgi:hypothetical protein